MKEYLLNNPSILHTVDGGYVQVQHAEDGHIQVRPSSVPSEPSGDFWEDETIPIFQPPIHESSEAEVLLNGMTIFAIVMVIVGVGLTFAIPIH